MDSIPSSHPEPSRRKTLLDEATRRRILAIVANGGSRRQAARSVGCNPSSITRLASRDPQFARQLAEARQAIQAECTQTILTAAFKHHNRHAAAWLAKHDYLGHLASQPLDAPILDRLADLLVRLARMSLDKALRNCHPAASVSLDDSIRAVERLLDAETDPDGALQRALHQLAQHSLDRNSPLHNACDDTHPPNPGTTP